MEVDAVSAVPLFENEKASRRMEASNDPFFVKSAKCFLKGSRRFVFAENTQTDQIRGARLHGERAAACETSLALLRVRKLYPS